MARRRRMWRWIYPCVALALAWLAFVAFWQEPRTLTVRALEVETPSWRARPLRVAFISDIHVDRFHMPPRRVAEIASRTGELAPDIIILGGDYVGGHFLRSGLPEAARSRRSRAEIALDEEGLRALGKFRAPLGVYAVMGNHDCWWDCARVREILSEHGVILLENRAVEVPRAGGSIWLAGIEGRADAKAGFCKDVGADPGRRFIADDRSQSGPVRLAGQSRRNPALGTYACRADALSADRRAGAHVALHGRDRRRLYDPRRKNSDRDAWRRRSGASGAVWRVA